MPPRKTPQAVSFVVRLPENATAAQARALSKAFEGVVVEFGRAMQVAGTKVKIEAVQGPAQPIRLDDVTGTGRVPGVVLKQTARRGR
jgi:hypothetical protein